MMMVVMMMTMGGSSGGSMMPMMLMMILMEDEKRRQAQQQYHHQWYSHPAQQSNSLREGFKFKGRGKAKKDKKFSQPSSESDQYQPRSQEQPIQDTNQVNDQPNNEVNQQTNAYNRPITLSQSYGMII